MSPVFSRMLFNWEKASNLLFRYQFTLSFKNSNSTVRSFPKHEIWRGLRRGQNHPDSNSLSPGTKFRLTPQNIVHVETLSFKTLRKPFLFTLMFSGLTFVGATIWQYENMRNQVKTSFIGSKLHHQPSFSYKQGGWRREINRWWVGLTEGQRVAWGIISLNAIVFLMWRVPAFHPMMLRYFCTNPASKTVCLPMVLSTFSHYSFWHFAANMFVLYSFSSTAVALFGKEQFTAMYLTAGVWSSFISYLHKIATIQAGLSLGASGSLMAVLGAVCVEYPDTQLAFLLLPLFTFSAGMAIKSIIALDTAGLILKWKIFDHAAHLGGVSFGILYLVYGRDHIWAKRTPIMQLWHDIREKPEK